MLTKSISGDQRNWDTKLPLVMMAYRSSEHESTGMSPAMMMFGREIELPVDLLFGHQSEMEENDNQARYVDDLKSRIGRVHQLARDKMAQANEKRKKGYDHRVAFNKFECGDAVLLRSRHKVGISPKLQSGWEGPCLVLKWVSDLVYRLQRSPKAQPKVFITTV